MYMKLKDGKSKVLTLSYDDCVVQDKRLIDLLNKYGLKATFNINTGMYLDEDVVRARYHGRMKFSEAKEAYLNSGHEIGVHGLNHPYLERLRTEEVLLEILEDRRNIEQQYGVITRGMAYPYGTYDDRVVEAVRQCGIAYCRTIKNTGGFGFPEDWLLLHPTCHHDDPKLMERAKAFVEEKARIKNRMFYLWGHTFEFDNNNNWEVIEKFAQYISGKDDIWYATNIEIYDYVKAYENLHVSLDKKIVHNPSAIDVWFMEGNDIYCVKGGQTLYL